MLAASCLPSGRARRRFGPPSWSGLPRDLSRVVRDEELAAAGLSKPLRGACSATRWAARRRRSRPLCSRHAFTRSALTSLTRPLPGWRALACRSGDRNLERRAWLVRGALDARGLGVVGGARSLRRTSARSCRRPDPWRSSRCRLFSGACASSTLAIGTRRGPGCCDEIAAMSCCAGGFDAVSVFVAAGFESLRATCGPSGPRPFREAARRSRARGGRGHRRARACAEARRARRVHGWIAGFGASCDATHLTAPDARRIRPRPSGDGGEFSDAGAPTIDLVSAHGTATRRTATAEPGRSRSPPGAPRALDVPIYLGEEERSVTLGAAGCARGALGARTPWREASRRLSARRGPRPQASFACSIAPRPSSARTALKLSSGVWRCERGALVLTPRATCCAEQLDPDGRRATYCLSSRAVRCDQRSIPNPRVACGAKRATAQDRIARADELVPPDHCRDGRARGHARRAWRACVAQGVIVGHGLATLETNARVLEGPHSGGGAPLAPSLDVFRTRARTPAAGECAVRLRPDRSGVCRSAAVLMAASRRSASRAMTSSVPGAADRIVVVAVDEVGDATARLGVTSTGRHESYERGGRAPRFCGRRTGSPRVLHRSARGRIRAVRASGSRFWRSSHAASARLPAGRTSS